MNVYGYDTMYGQKCAMTANAATGFINQHTGFNSSEC